MLHVCKERSTCCSFRDVRRDDLQNTGIDPAIENRRIVWTFIFEAARRKAESSISYNFELPISHCYTF